MVRRALPEDLRDAQSVAAFSREVDEVYHDSWHICTRLYDGIPEMLDRLAAAGYPMAVLSNKPEHFTQRMVAHFLGQWPFAVVRGARDGCPLKPNPAASLHIAEILRTAPAHMAHVGDSDIDMHTATAAGMLPAGVTWGFRTKGELQRAGAAMLIDEPSHIPAVFNDAT
jgi:phosphoglycolate phosphatase